MPYLGEEQREKPVGTLSRPDEAHVGPRIAPPDECSVELPEIFDLPLKVSAMLWYILLLTCPISRRASKFTQVR